MRDPSIHIKKSSFILLLKEVEVENFPVDDFFSLSRKYSVDSRAVNINNKKDNKKVNNITLVNNGNANLAADILYAVQIELKHRGVKKIKENQGNLWTSCKKLAEVCNIFCKDFNLDLRYGYIKYIKLGFKRMGPNIKNFLNRLISMSSNITNDYQAYLDISKDEYPEGTLQIHNYYCKVIADRAGFKVDYRNQPESYIYFLKLREFCYNNNINYEDWIDSQFEGLAWCNGLPDPDKLLGDKANSYYAKFKFKNNNKNQDQDDLKVSGSLWNKIKEEDD